MAGVRKRMLNRLEGLGHWIFYVTLRYCGRRAASWLLWPVITCYLLCSGKIHRLCRPYLERRFPDSSRAQRWWHCHRLVRAYGEVLVERGWLGLDPKVELQCEFVGRNRLFALLNQRKGVVLLTAHVGNWQSALAHLSCLPVKVHALMRYDRQAVSKHFFDLGAQHRKVFDIIDAEGEFGGMVEATAALGRGEIVTIMGDRYVGGSSSTVRFLGKNARFPNSAYQLAAMAGAPVVILFATRTGVTEFTLEVWDSFWPERSTRDRRAEMLEKNCRRFAMALEEYVDEYPYQWYNFFDFWKQ